MEYSITFIPNYNAQYINMCVQVQTISKTLIINT
jgi:hypothetical protein